MSYAIAFGNDAGYFAISNSTGALSVIVGLDYQLAQSYSLLVMVSKAKLPSFQTGCTVFINGAFFLKETLIYCSVNIISPYSICSHSD